MSKSSGISSRNDTGSICKTFFWRISMKTQSLRVAAMCAGIGLAVSVSQASLIQVGSGGTTNPGAWTTGNPTVDSIGVTLNQSVFTAAGLWDSVTSSVGGGTVSGDLYYAFTAIPLDRVGQWGFAAYPSGRPIAPYVARPSNSFGGGQTLLGSTQLTTIGQGYGQYDQGYTTGGAPGAGGSNYQIDGANRADIAPDRLAVWQIKVHFVAGGNDTVSGSVTLYDNGSTTPTITRTNSNIYTGNSAFDAFRFISGHGDAYANRWTFSNVAFATTASEALAAVVPEPASLAMLALGSTMILLRPRNDRPRNVRNVQV